MENLLIGIMASFVMFLLFFLVFLLREKNTSETRHLHGCGQPKGQCHCRQHDAKISSQEFNLQRNPAEWRMTPEAPCPLDASVKKSTGNRQKPS